MVQYRILVVDDEPKVAFFFQKHLEMISDTHLVTSVNSGQEALAEIQKHDYALMITDLRMPDINGLELIRRVRRISPQTQTILVTAYGSKNVWQKAEHLHVFRALSKPLKVDKLISAVREALAGNAANSADVVAVSGDHLENVARRIKTLQVDVGAHAVILADTTGHVVSRSGTVSRLDAASVLALLGGAMAVAGELTDYLQYTSDARLTYYEGPPYDLYAVAINKHFFLALFFDRRQETQAASRIGTVWLYARRAVTEIRALLQQSRQARQAEEMSLDKKFTVSLEGQLDDLFGSSSAAASQPKSQPKLQAKPANQSTVATTLPQKVESLLRQVMQQPYVHLTYDLSVLPAVLPSKQASILLKVMRCCLKEAVRQKREINLSVQFGRKKDALHGRIHYTRLIASLAYNKEFQEVQHAFQINDGKFNIRVLPGDETEIFFVLPLPE